jgi:cation diffusion facilitator family transporter
LQIKRNTAARPSLTRYAWISIAAALATIALKSAAYLLTGSVGLLSDAIESVVNLVGAVMALAMLTIASEPEDEEHAFGHSKAEYFSSGVEGTLIMLAAISIAVTAVNRLLHPQPLEKIGMGFAVSMAASAINGTVALILQRAAVRYESITLKADAQHLLTDVWTSAGVLAALGLVTLTHWTWLDPVIALAVAANISRIGRRIVNESIHGLMDTALPAGEVATIRAILDSYAKQGVGFHALRTRQAGSRRFVYFHIQAPGGWTIHHGHSMLEKIEFDIRHALRNVTIWSHLESLDDPRSFQDQQLDRY